MLKIIILCQERENEIIPFLRNLLIWLLVENHEEYFRRLRIYGLKQR
jgi:hypothetical protein